MMPVSDAEIESAKTPAGGWTRKQLAAWGVEWPPKKGWRRNLIEGSQNMPAVQGNLTEIQGRIWNDFSQTGRSHVDSVVEILTALCESPIEVMLGSAIYLGTSVALGPLEPTKMLRIQPHDAGVADEPYSGQWVLVPQYKWDRYRIDFALRTKLRYPIFIECDGHDFHERTKDDAQRDRERDRAIQGAGIPILRFTGSEIYKSPQACAFQVFTFASKRILETLPRFTPEEAGRRRSNMQRKRKAVSA